VTESQDSSVSIVMKLRSGQSSIQFPAGPMDFSLPQIAQTGSGAHPSSYFVVTVGSSTRGKVVKA
jgi:hypothetical protein